ncbi:MAG: hypothetical protein C0402_09130 [Thermodesulfovibrio sp.]|nr:hypothetical protein [Thermodesulfovibrio sp.]
MYGYAWYVSFSSGIVGTVDKQQTLYVRAVRNGEGGAIGNSDLSVSWLSTSTEDDRNEVVVGRPLTYSFTVTNLGPHNALGAVFTYTLPAGVVFGSASWNLDPLVSCIDSNPSGTVTCALGALMNGVSGVVSLTLTAPQTAGEMTVRAAVLSETNDAVLSNNSLDVTTTVVYRLGVAVQTAGGANGLVTSSPPGSYAGADNVLGISCSSATDPVCTYDSDRFTATDINVVTLNATVLPSNGGRTTYFAGWQGECSGTSGCVVTVNGDKAVTALFTTDLTAPVTTALPAGGTFKSSASVLLACFDAHSGCDKTYYCLGAGCTPTSIYTGQPIKIPHSTMLRFYSRDKENNSEQIRSETYHETGQTARNTYYRSRDEWLVMAYAKYSDVLNTYQIYLAVLDANTKALVPVQDTRLAANPLLLTDSAGAADITLVYDEGTGTGFVFYYDNQGYESFLRVPHILPYRPGDPLLQAPGSVDMGEVIVNSSKYTSVTISNTGTADLHILSVIAPAMPFSWVGGTCNTTQGLSPSATCVMEIRVISPVSGALTGEFTIISDGGTLTVQLRATAL